MVSIRKSTKVAVVGLGNVSLTDDGVGVHAVRRLKEKLPADVACAEIGTALLDALDLFEDAEIVIALDAVKAGHAPGSLYCLSGRDVQDPPPMDGRGLGLCSVLERLPAAVRPQLIILGVEPAVIAYGMEPSPVVKRSIPQLVQLARAMVHEISHHHNPLTCIKPPAMNLRVQRNSVIDYEAN